MKEYPIHSGFKLTIYICIFVFTESRVSSKLSKMTDCDIMNLTTSTTNPVRDDSGGQIEQNLTDTRPFRGAQSKATRVYVQNRQYHTSGRIHLTILIFFFFFFFFF